MSNLYYNILIANKMKSRRLAKQNSGDQKDDNTYIRAEKEQYKQILSEMKKHLWTYKSGIGCIILSILVMIASPIAMELVFKANGGSWETVGTELLFIFLMAMFPGLSIFCAIGLKNGGPLGIIYNLKNQKIRLDDDELIYTYDTLDGNYTENYVFTYHMIKAMKYKDIKRITYNEETRRYMLYGRFYIRRTDNEKCGEKAEKEYLEIYDIFDDSEGFREGLIEKSGRKIEVVKKREILKKIDYAGLLLFYLFLLLASPFTLFVI